MSNTYFAAVMSQAKGIEHIKNKLDHSETPVTHGYYWYCPMNNSGGRQASGAYILRPCTPDAEPTSFAEANGGSFAVSAVVVDGPVCKEFRSTVDKKNNIHETVRLCVIDRFLSIQTGIGEIEADAVGKEVVMKLGTNIKSKGKWYADGQGLEMVERVRNERRNYPYTVTEPVASNFFPSNVWSYISEDLSPTIGGKTLAVVSDVTRAVTSLKDGELEFLVIRRSLFDDARGVGQALNESIRLITTSRLYIAAYRRDAVTSARLATILHSHPLLKYFSSSTPAASLPALSEEAIGIDPLEKPIHLHTRQLIGKDTFLVRLQHPFAKGESPTMAVARTVDLRDVVPRHLLAASPTSGGGSVTSFTVTELDLNGVTPLAEINKKRKAFLTCVRDKWHKWVTVKYPTPFTPSGGGAADTVVEINPMEIRTYRVKLHRDRE